MKFSLKKAIFALVCGIAVLVSLFYYRNFVDVQAFSVATIWVLKGVEPKDQRVLPFYYTIGAFQFDSQGLMPRIEYRKGSPLQFVHSISWDNLKDTRIEVRGPKTPFKDQTVDTLRNCMTHMIFAAEDTNGCIRFRTQFLAKEMREIKDSTESSQIQVRWFEIENPVLSENDSPRGIYLSASGPKSREERYIFILPKGTLQSWSLRFSSDDLVLARFETFVRGIRISDQLEKSRALIDPLIQKTELNPIQKISKPTEKIAALTQVQTLLLSKISISPGEIHAFLHLGGTARLMHFEAQTVGRYDLSAQSRSLIEGALLYARGIDLKSDATFQLEKLAVEVRGRSK